MKNEILFLFAFLFISAISNAQICGTPAPSISMKQQFNFNQNSGNFNDPLCINLFFHIVRDNNGAGGINPSQLQLITDDLNSFYDIHNISFINAGFDFIDNTSFVSIGSSIEANSLAQVNNLPNSINYYIVNNLWSQGAGTVTGTALSIPSNRLVIRQDRVLTSTSSHEVGHCLDLIHTHETALGTEAIDGSNCSTAGDLVCDTPADPQLGNSNVDMNCAYTGGGGYNPSTHNIMSYAPNLCRDEFTTEQGQRMRASIMNKPLLSQLINNNCSVASISSIGSLCSQEEATVVINNLNGATVTWQTSSNIQIVSSTNQSVTISPASFGNSGAAWVDAILSSGIVLRENFNIGVPSPNQNPIVSGPNLLHSYESGLFYTSNNNFSNYSNVEWVVYSNNPFPSSPLFFEIHDVNSNPFAAIVEVLPAAPSGSYVAQCRVSNNCGTYYIDKTFTVEEAIPQFYPRTNEKTSIFPNPANSEINITSPSKGMVSIMNSLGILVKQTEINDGTTLIDINELEIGMYLLKIDAGDKISTHKFVKR